MGLLCSQKHKTGVIINSVLNTVHKDSALNLCIFHSVFALRNLLHLNIIGVTGRLIKHLATPEDHKP